MPNRITLNPKPSIPKAKSTRFLHRKLHLHLASTSARRCILRPLLGVEPVCDRYARHCSGLKLWIAVSELCFNFRLPSPNPEPESPSPKPETHLGRDLGHFIFALIGLKRILFTNIFQEL